MTKVLWWKYNITIEQLWPIDPIYSFLDAFIHQLLHHVSTNNESTLRLTTYCSILMYWRKQTEQQICTCTLCQSGEELSLSLRASLVLLSFLFFCLTALSLFFFLWVSLCVSAKQAFQCDLLEASRQSVWWERILHGAFSSTGTPGHFSNGSIQKPQGLKSFKKQAFFPSFKS